MGIDLFRRDRTGYDFHSRVPLYFLASKRVEYLEKLHFVD